MPILAPGLDTSYDFPENAIDISQEFYDLKIPNNILYNLLSVGKRAKDTMVKWYDDVTMPVSTTLGAGYTAAAGTMTLADINFVRVGSVIRVESSLYRVTEVNLSTKVATITILSGDANHANGKVVEIVGNAQVEGKAFAATATQTVVERTNYCQIFDEAAEVSGTEEAVQSFDGSVGKMGKETAKKLAYLARQVARSLWGGVPLNATDNTTPRMMGGVKYFIETNGYCPAGASFTGANIDAFLLELSKRGGDLVEIWGNPSVAGKFSALKDDQVIAERSDSVVGRIVKTYLSGNGFSLSINADPACLDTDAFYVFPSSQLSLRPLRPMQSKAQAENGDSSKALIVGEYSLEFHNSQACGKFTISG